MALLNPYIHFNGNAEEAFTFYRSVNFPIVKNQFWPFRFW